LIHQTIPSSFNNHYLAMSAIDDEIEDSVNEIEIKRSQAKARRKSDVDAVHSILPPSHVSPAQLYSTESGHLYHAGKMCIVLVGLPARGKTHHTVALTRYLRWLGVKTHAFHLGDYRRKLSPPNFTVPEDYFMENAKPETVKFRKSVIDSCVADMFKFFEEDMGQVGIYDAVNATAGIRRRLAETFGKRNIQVMFVECLCTDEKIVARNIRDVKLSSPDYQDVDPDEAVRHYMRRIELRIPHYETMNEPELTYIKLINASERCIIQNGHRFGYLGNRIVFFLMNTRIKLGSVYFARAGQGNASEEGRDQMETPLSEEGKDYAQRLKVGLFKHMAERRELFLKTASEDILDQGLLRRVRASHEIIKQNSSMAGGGKMAMGDITPPVESGTSTPLSSADARAVSTIRADALNLSDISKLTVWCSTRRRTVETAEYFQPLKITQLSQLTQLNQGAAKGLTAKELKEKYPFEYERHQQDPYHHRFPRGESYQDLAVRLEPLILEMERIPGDLLIVAHESVLTVLYGYLMACTVSDIPFLKFSRDELVEIIPNAYVNQANRLKLPVTLVKR
jgi:6-phosphofructo-2-kinase / fructose-2,6-biphosphatase 4